MKEEEEEEKERNRKEAKRLVRSTLHSEKVEKDNSKVEVQPNANIDEEEAMAAFKRLKIFWDYLITHVICLEKQSIEREKEEENLK